MLEVKLTKVQKESIASEIISKISKEISIRNKLVTDSEEYQNYFDEDENCKVLIETCKRYGLENSYHLNELLKNIKNKEFKSKLLSTNIPSSLFPRIVNKLSLLSIDSKFKDLDELINYLYDLYKDEYINKFSGK